MLKNALIIGVAVSAVLWGGNYLFITWQINRFEDQQIKMVDFSRELNNIQLHKLQIADFYSRHGRFPEDNQDLGIAPAETFRNINVKRRSIGPNGLIDIAFNDSVGKEARLTFIPTPNLTRVGSTIQWRCFISGIEITSTTQQVLGTNCEALPGDMTIASVVKETTPKATVDNLINAVYGRREALVHTLISQGANINGANEKGDTPLSTAVENGDVRMIQLLKKAGGNVNQRLKKNKKTLLMHAIDEQRGRSSNVIKTLLKSGQKLEARDKNGKTALMYAAINDDSYTLRILMKAGASLQASDRNGLRAINYAEKNGRNSSTYQALYKAENKPVEFIIKLPERDF